MIGTLRLIQPNPVSRGAGTNGGTRYQIGPVFGEIGLTWGYWRGVPNDEDWRNELISCLLHEVAHVFAGVEAGHGTVWRDEYISLLEEWFAPHIVVRQILYCSEVDPDWIRTVFLPASKARCPDLCDVTR